MITLAPGATIGILGSGQLGRMLAIAAAQLGYRTHIFAPETGPANDVSASFTQAGYYDEEALLAFARSVDVITYEFENIPSGPLEKVLERRAIHPAPAALAVAQDRTSEKEFVRQLGGRTAAYRAVNDRDALEAAVADLGCPAVLKTTRFGYDGKGQARLNAPADADEAWNALGSAPAVLEAFVPFEHEFSIILARGQDGSITSYPPPLNEHQDGILARSSLPAPALVASQWTEAAALAGRVADALDYVGVLTLEFFASADGPVFNEMAPRVHNSGHWTIEGAETSQFENHIRAICGLPLGQTTICGVGVEMRNLIGGEADTWQDLLGEPGTHLHLYGKRDARPGRKMGHITRVVR